MKRQAVSQKAIKRSVARSTKASARIESRVVPTSHVRSESVSKYVATRKSRD